jgi:Concanavalin A-like lectin/glucanases superfamily
MAIEYNPNVVTNNLVMYYDMNNTQKSWKGQPATNQVTYPYADWTGSAFSLSYNYDATSTATQTYTTNISNPVNSPGIFRYFTGTTGYKYWAFRTTVPSAGTYTFSYYARISGGSPNTINMQQIWRDTDATDRTPTGNWNPTFTSNWARYTLTSTVTTYLDMFICHSGSMTGGIQLDLCGFQLESGTYATPFVAGSRSTTTALADLTNNNTLTANSLTYTSTAFSFNGSSNYIYGGNSNALNLTDNLTLETWVYISSFVNYGGIVTWGSDAGEQYNLGTTSSNTVIFSTNWPGTWYIGSSTALSTNTWYNAVATFTGGAWKIYINGVLNNSGTFAITVLPTVSGSWLNVGMNQPGGDEFFNGQIPVAKIYNTALTAAQVAQNFQALRGRYGV